MKPRRGRRPDSRDHGRPIKILVNEEERAEIERLAGLAGYPVSTFLREVGLNGEVRSLVDLDVAREIAGLSGNLGRIGGLLKLWLAERRDEVPVAEMNRALRRVFELQDQSLQVMSRILKHHKRRSGPRH